MLAPNWYPQDKQLRQFAVACLPGCLLVGFVQHFWWRGLGWATLLADTAFGVLTVIGAVLLVAGLAAPAVVRPVYFLLMAVTVPIGWLISNLFLRILFYVLMTPLGWLFRAMGRDPLLLKRPQLASYWIEHPQRTDAVSYYRQA